MNSEICESDNCNSEKLCESDNTQAETSPNASSTSLPSFLHEETLSMLRSAGVESCSVSTKEALESWNSQQDALLGLDMTKEELHKFFSIAALHDRREVAINGYSILCVANEDLEETESSLRANSINLTVLNSLSVAQPNVSIPENTTLLLGTAGSIAEFFRSDLGRSSKVCRLLVTHSQGEIEPEVKDMLGEACKRGQRPQLILLYKTITEAAKDMARSFLRSTATTETHYYVQVDPDGKSRVQTLVDTLQSECLFPALVFCRSSAETNTVEVALNRVGLTSLKLVGRVPTHKIKEMQMATKSGATKVLLCTDGPSEHLELELFPLIVNFSIPSEPETYIHRTENPLGNHKNRKVLSIITQLDQSNFDYIKKIVSAQFERSSGPDIQVALDRQCKQIENDAAENIGLVDDRLRTIASQLAQSPRAADVIAHLLHLAGSRSEAQKESAPRRGRIRNEEQEGDDRREVTSAKRGRGAGTEQEHTKEIAAPIERPQVQFVIKKTARIYIGHGSDNGIQPAQISDIKLKNDQGDDVEIVGFSIRPHYTFIDIDDSMGERLVDFIKNNPPSGIKDICVNKALTISSKERVAAV